MTKKFLILGMAVLLSFAFVLASCGDDDPDDKDPGKGRNIKTTNIPTPMVATTGGNIVEIKVDPKSKRSARAALEDGIYEYTVEMYGVVVAEGVMIIKNGECTFYPNAKVTVTPIFTYDPETEMLDGSIPISQDVIDAVEALGGTLGNTLDLTDCKASPARPGGDGYWNGTWVNENTDGTVDEIVFNGNSYTLKKDGAATETGTFVYLDGFMKNDHSNLFIFTRPAGKTPKVMAYLYEGGFNYENADGSAFDPDVDDIKKAVKSDEGFLELYHESFNSDVMGIDKAYNDNKFNFQQP